MNSILLRQYFTKTKSVRVILIQRVRSVQIGKGLYFCSFVHENFASHESLIFYKRLRRSGVTINFGKHLWNVSEWREWTSCILVTMPHQHLLHLFYFPLSALFMIFPSYMSNLCNFFSNKFLNFRVIISFSKAGVSLAIKYYGIIYISFIFVYASERNLSGKDSLKRRALSENAFIYFSLLLWIILKYSSWINVLLARGTNI